MAQRTPIGRLLVERGLASLAAVETAALSAPGGDSRLCSKLLEAGACGEGDLAEALADRHGVPGVDLSRSVVDLGALEAVPEAVAEADLILPLSREGDRLHLAVASPEKAARVVAEVRFVTGLEVSLYVAVLAALREAISGCYQAKARGAVVWRGAAAAAGAGPSIAVRLGREVARDPADLPELPPDLLLDESAPEHEVDLAEDTGEQVVHAVAVRAGPRRILVVDDEPAIRLLAQRALEHRGYRVETAADGLEALALARRGAFDLVLLDAMLPRLHGFEVALRLRADPVTRAVPIVVMTAVYRGWRFAQDARDSYGAQDYVEKPFRVDDLLRRIEAVLEAGQAGPDAGVAAPLLVEGRAAAAAGRPEQAVAAFEEAIRADPFSADAHHGLGEALRARGDAFRAMTALERAVDLRPRLFPALRSLAALYLEKGFRAKAAETLERALRAAPDALTREELRRELLPLL